MVINSEKLYKVVLKNKIKEKILLLSNDKVFSEDNKLLNAKYRMTFDVLRIEWNNGIIHYYIKCNDFYQMHYFDNFDLEYYRNQINGIKIKDWVSGMDHWFFEGRLKNKKYFEKSNIIIDDNMFEVYINYSHMNIVDFVNDKKYIFKIKDNIYEINTNPYKNIDNKIIYEKQNNSIVKYTKKDNIYQEIGDDIYNKIHNILKDNEKIIVYYNKDSIELLKEKIDILKYLDNDYLKIILTVDNIFNYDKEYNLLIISNIYNNQIFIKSNILIYYTNHLLYDEIIKYNKKKIYEINYYENINYNIFNKELNNIILNNEYVIYDDVLLYNFLNKIDCSKDYYYINRILNNITKMIGLKNILEDII